VHASQFGTLSRLAHAVDLGMVAEGWGIDEDTVLEVSPDALRVYGKGHVYRIQAGDHGSTLTIYTDGAAIERPAS
jgi:cyanophycinase-like exopeptidase